MKEQYRLKTVLIIISIIVLAQTVIGYTNDFGFTLPSSDTNTAYRDDCFGGNFTALEDVNVTEVTLKTAANADNVKFITQDGSIKATWSLSGDVATGSVIINESEEIHILACHSTSKYTIAYSGTKTTDETDHFTFFGASKIQNVPPYTAPVDLGFYVNVLEFESESYTYPTPPTDNCSCPGLNNNWIVDLSDNCDITTACDLGTGHMEFTNTGSFTCDATIDVTYRHALPSNSHFKRENDCVFNLG